MFLNILANYTSKIWGILSLFLFVPYYIKILGIESYAIINYYTIILTLLYFADSGLSATLNREIARTGDHKYIGDMVFTIEIVYSFICCTIFLAIFIFSSYISIHWLNSRTISQENIAYYIKLMGASAAIQLFISLENSGLLGLEKQVLSNFIQISHSIFKTAVVIIPLHFYPSLELFFWWQLVVNIIFLFLTRLSLKHFIKTNSKSVFDKNIIKSVYKFAGGMMVMAIISSLNTQIDKLMVSKFLSLEDFGYYSISGIICQAPIILITPIAIAIMPKMVSLSNNNNLEELRKIFHKYSFITTLISIVTTTVIFTYTYDYINIWTNNTNIADKSFITAKLMIIGSLFLCFQYMPYHLAIANGHTSTNIKLGFSFILIYMPSIYYLINYTGLNGATMPWIVMNFIAFIYLGKKLITKYLKNEFKKWLLYDIILPIVVVLLIGALVNIFTENLPKGYYIILYSTIIGIISILCNLIIFNKLNPENKISFNAIINYGK